MNYNAGKTHPKFIELTGKKIGQLSVIDYVHRKGRGNENRWVWKCMCECGNICYVRTTKLLKKFPQTSCKVCSDSKWSKDRILGNFLSVKKRIYRTYIRGAKNRNHCFELTFEEFESIISQNCYYCDGSPTENKGDQPYTYGQGVFKRNGIDRKNNDFGYTIDNVVPCCEICNRAKLNLSMEIFENWIKRIYNKLKLK